MKRILDTGVTYENDPEGFIVPFEVHGILEKEVLFHKYKKITKVSRGTIIRLGFA